MHNIQKRRRLVAALGLMLLVAAAMPAAQHTRLFRPEDLGELEGPDRDQWQSPDKIMDAHPRRIARTPRVMSEAYKSILAGLVARGWAPPREPVRLSKSRIAMIVLRHFII